MRIFKTLIIAAFAFATSAGMLLAADDPLEIHGGGRVGWTTNGKLGAEGGSYASNELGSMPNYGSSNYFGFSVSKKVTSEGGAWAKTSIYLDSWNPDIKSDLQTFNWRRRDFHVEFGGLDFLPAGSVLWGGLRGYGTGYNGQQDHSFINFSGIGLGLQNIGGLFSVAYMHERSTSDGAAYEGLGQHVCHNIIANVNTPIVEVYGAFGFAKKSKNVDKTTDPSYTLTDGTKDGGTADGNVVGRDKDGNPIYSNDSTNYETKAGSTTTEKQKNYTTFAVAGLFHAPVAALNIGALYAKGGYARESWTDQRSDTCISSFAGLSDEKTVKGAMGFSIFSVTAWTVTDLAPGFYTSTALRYDMGKGNKDSNWLTDNTGHVIHVSSRWGKSLTKNIGVTGTIGFGREWAKKDDLAEKASHLTKKAATTIQFTPAVEIGLDTGYWASPKIQVYGTITKVDSKHKFNGYDYKTDATAKNHAYFNKTTAFTFGSLVTFGF